MFWELAKEEAPLDEAPLDERALDEGSFEVLATNVCLSRLNLCVIDFSSLSGLSADSKVWFLVDSEVSMILDTEPKLPVQLTCAGCYSIEIFLYLLRNS